MQLYKVKLYENHTAEPSQVINGYLASYPDELGIYTRGQALKKARNFNGFIEPHGKSYTVNKTSICELLKQEVSKHVLRELEDREVYIDSDDDINEPIYYGDVFAAILGDHSDDTKLSFNINQDVIDELTILDKLCANYDYVRLT